MQFSVQSHREINKLQNYVSHVTAQGEKKLQEIWADRLSCSAAAYLPMQKVK